MNRVGVELNTASARAARATSPASGPRWRKHIVAAPRRATAPSSRARRCSKVPGLGPKAFEQAAGFLRVRGGEHPLDASAVHPERYALVERMAQDLGVPRGVAGRERGRRRAHRAAEVRGRRRRAARRCTTSSPSCASRGATRARRSSRPTFRDDVQQAGGPEGGHGARGRGDQRHRVRRLRRRRRAPGRPRARLAARPTASSRTPTRW